MAVVLVAVSACRPTSSSSSELATVSPSRLVSSAPFPAGEKAYQGADLGIELIYTAQIYYRAAYDIDYLKVYGMLSGRCASSSTAQAARERIQHNPIPDSTGWRFISVPTHLSGKHTSYHEGDSASVVPYLLSGGRAAQSTDWVLQGGFWRLDSC